MGAIHRMATLGDAGRLYCIRRQSILVLAPPLMAAVEAEVWAAKLSPAGMERKLRDLEIWVAELDGTVAGWGAIRGGYLEGLYTAPEFAGRGVGGDLLDLLERLMRGRGIAAVEAEAARTRWPSTSGAVTGRTAHKPGMGPGPLRRHFSPLRERG